MIPGFIVGALGAAKKIWHITVGNDGTSYGWDGDGVSEFGSITPDASDDGDVKMFLTVSSTSNYIFRIYTPTLGGSDLSVAANAEGIAQTAFTTIHVYDGAAWRSLNTADATAFNNSSGGRTLWAFGDGTDDVFANTSGGEIRGVYIT